MNNKAEHNAASIAQLIFENKLEDIFIEFTPEVVIPFLQKALVNDSDFGKEGQYSFFCKHCSKSWSFITKDERRIFERIHKVTGCVLVWNAPSGRRKTGGWVSSDKKNIRPGAEKSINIIISAITKTNSERSATEDPKPDTVLVDGAISDAA